MRNASRNPVRKANDNANRERAPASLHRNIKIHMRRTSLRLEPEMWNALHDVAETEGMTIHDICSAVDDCKKSGESFASALRVFLLKYYRAAAEGVPKALFRKRLRSPQAGTDGND